MITAEQLHKWYLEAITHLDGNDYNHMADRPYEDLTEGQKSIDKYIADKIMQAIEARMLTVNALMEILENNTDDKTRETYKYIAAESIHSAQMRKLRE